MDDLDSIKTALQPIHFHNFRQYISALLNAFKIPHLTIERLLSKADRDSFKSPIYIYRRAIIICDTSEKRTFDLARIERDILGKTATGFRLLIAINNAFVVCKNFITGTVIEFKPDEICNHVLPFSPLIYGMIDEKDIDTTVDFAELIGTLFNQLSLTNNNYSENPKKLTDFVLTLIHLSFAQSLFQNKAITDIIHWALNHKRTEYNTIIAGIFDAILHDNIQGLRYENLPRWNICLDMLNDLPNIDSKSFNYVVKVLCYDLCHIDTEVLGSLIYRLIQNEDLPSVYGHHTSYQNVIKILNPLFVNDYVQRIDSNKHNPRNLSGLRNELLELTFFDPTNGPGCFLTSSLNNVINLIFSIDHILMSSARAVNVGNFIGLVDNSVSRKLTRLSLWVSYLQYLYKLRQIDEADLEVTYKDINIYIGDQLECNWADFCPNHGKTLIIGAPTFKGKIKTTAIEKLKMKSVFFTSKYGDADFCSCWLYLAAKYINSTTSRCAFVLTNSVCQGSQVAFIWERIFICDCEICFAYRSFKWKNTNQTTIGVSVIVIGISSISCDNKSKYLYADNLVVKTDCIGPYLIDGTKAIVRKRTKPLSKQLPPMVRGNMPYDGGHLLLSKKEKEELVSKYPETVSFLRKIVGSKELIDGIERWCLWISSPKAAEALSIPPIAQRVEKTKQCRLLNSDPAVRKLAQRPYQFREFLSTVNQTLVIPAVSSENRPYIPIGFIGSDTIVSNLAFTIYECNPWIFGILSSRMHMAWIRTVCGCLETRLRYSNHLGYNTFPFPDIPAEKILQIHGLSLDIISEREKYCHMSLGALYSDLPPGLKLIHEYLDECIDSCYQSEPFISDVARVKLLFTIYEKRA
jgi:hypothetical protein